MSTPADQAAKPAPAPVLTLALLQKEITALTARVTALEAAGEQVRVLQAQMDGLRKQIAAMQKVPS